MRKISRLDVVKDDKLQLISFGCLRYDKGTTITVGKVVKGYVTPKENPNVRINPCTSMWKVI